MSISAEEILRKEIVRLENECKEHQIPYMLAVGDDYRKSALGVMDMKYMQISQILGLQLQTKQISLFDRVDMAETKPIPINNLKKLAEQLHNICVATGTGMLFVGVVGKDISQWICQIYTGLYGNEKNKHQNIYFKILQVFVSKQDLF